MRTHKSLWPVMLFGFILFLSNSSQGEENGVKIFGDVSFRYQGLYDVDFTYLSNLEAKFRLGATKQVNDRITAYLRFDTGPQNSPTGTWPTMGDELKKVSFLLNRAYLNYRSDWGLDFIVGKFDNPFIAPIYGVGASELVFDADVPFTGAALSWNQVQEGEWKEGVRVMADYNSLTYRYSSNPVSTSAYSIGGQIAYRFPFGLTASLSDVFFNEEGFPEFESAITGNATNSLGMDQFNLINLNASYEREMAGKPLTLLGDWVMNTEADSLRHGLLGQIAWGSAKQIKGWQIGLRFTWIQQDAVISKLNEDQSRTNLAGFMPWFKWKPLDNTQIFFTLYVTDVADGPDLPILWRPRLYYIVNF